MYLWTANGSREHVVVALSTALAVLIPVDILRLRYPTFERLFEKCVGIFMRDSERVRKRILSALLHVCSHRLLYLPEKVQWRDMVHFRRQHCPRHASP